MHLLVNFSGMDRKETNSGSFFAGLSEIRQMIANNHDLLTAADTQPKATLPLQKHLELRFRVE